MGFLRLTPVIIFSLKIFFYQVTYLSGALFLPDTLHAEPNAITPDRTITVVADQPDVPEWKTLWDKARENVRQNQYPAALKLYEELLKEKPNIEEANWEFCKVLLKLEDFSSAATIIATLVEKNPLRIEYLMTAGTVNLQQKNYPLAIKYFGKVYELDPDGSDSTPALAGLIDSLKGDGKDDAALSLLEQLHVREPNNVTRLHELARAAGTAGRTNKAEKYYTKLLKMGPVDDRILFQASELFENTNNIKMVVPLWEEYVRRHQNYLPFRQKLIEFYLVNNEGMAALPHLLFIDDKVDSDDQLKLQIATIYLHDAKRPDKALSYYEKYLLQNPDDQNVRSDITYIQSILANDFLAIVENDGAWLLWRDLVEVTPNRLGIYLEMATLLEKKGKSKELLEILLIISDNKPQNDKVNFRIIDLYRQKKEYGRALDYIGKITASHNSTKKYFLLKGNIEELAGLEKKALSSYGQALKVEKNDLDLRKKCIEKAGALGMVEELENFFINNPVNHYNRKHIHFILNYLDQLAYNSMFSKLESMYEYFLNVFKNDPGNVLDLQFHRVQTLRKEGKTRKSEELLRKLSNVEHSAVEALSRLAFNAVDNGDMQAFRSWYGAVEDKIQTYPPSQQKSLFHRKKALLDVKKVLFSGDLSGAAYLLTDLRENLPKASNRNLLDEPGVYHFEKELCWQYLDKKDFRKCRSILKRLQKNKLFDPEIVAIHTKLSRESKGTIDTLPSQYDLTYGENPIISRLLQVAQIELKHKEYNSARRHLNLISKAEINSLVGKQLQAELSFKKGELKKAVDLYRDLYDRYSGEGYFLKKIVVSESKRGDFRNALAALLKNNGRLGNINNAADYNDLSQDIEEVLFFARMLWGDKQQKKSLKVYELLLKPSVIDLLEQRLDFKELYSHYFTEDKSISNSLRSLKKNKLEIIAELMKPQFLIDNLGNESGKIIADHYELYSWQKMILGEYHTRNEIVQQNLAFADRYFTRPLEEEKNFEVLAGFPTSRVSTLLQKPCHSVQYPLEGYKKQEIE